MHYVCFCPINSRYVFFALLLFFSHFSIQRSQLIGHIYLPLHFAEHGSFIAIGTPVLGIKEVYYGCANDKFGGCGSILSLHLGSRESPTRFISLSTIIRF